MFGKKKQGRPKREKELDDFEEGEFIEGLEDEPKEDDSDEKEDTKLDDALEEIEERFKRDEKAIRVNQKYLKKM
jgi:hypothetical protein